MSNGELKDLFRKNRLLLMIVMLSCVILIGSSYAWYSLDIVSEKTTTVIVGNLELALDENSDTVTLENAVPQSDESGMKNNPYNFTITNTGDLASKYTIYLEDSMINANNVRMSDSAIKFNLSYGDDDEVIVSGYLNSLLGTNGKRSLAIGELDAGEKVDYKLRIWIAEEATTEISGQEFLAKITMEATQINSTDDVINNVNEGTNNGTSTIIP